VVHRFSGLESGVRFLVLLKTKAELGSNGSLAAGSRTRFNIVKRNFVCSIGIPPSALATWTRRAAANIEAAAAQDIDAGAARFRRLQHGPFPDFVLHCVAFCRVGAAWNLVSVLGFIENKGRPGFEW